MPTDPTVLLADADVLIDYRESELAILGLVGRHVGRVAVLPSVLEVEGVTAAECAELGIEVVEVETERMLRAAEIESPVSFNDRLCFVTCLEEGWTCVTNDGALRRLCERHGVDTRFGLALMVNLVAAGVLSRERAEAVARQIHASNPLHINQRVLTRFVGRVHGFVDQARGGRSVARGRRAELGAGGAPGSPLEACRSTDADHRASRRLYPPSANDPDLDDVSPDLTIRLAGRPSGRCGRLDTREASRRQARRRPAEAGLR